MISRRVRDFDPVFVSFAEVSRASLLDTFDATSDYLIKGWHLYGTLRIRTTYNNDDDEEWLERITAQISPVYKCSALPLETLTGSSWSYSTVKIW